MCTTSLTRVMLTAMGLVVAMSVGAQAQSQGAEIHSAHYAVVVLRMNGEGKQTLDGGMTWRALTAKEVDYYRTLTERIAAAHDQDNRDGKENQSASGSDGTSSPRQPATNDLLLE